MLVGGVVHDQVDDDPHAVGACLVGEFDEVAGGAEARVDAVVVRDVVAVVAIRSGLEGHQPHRGHPQAGEVVQPPHQPLEVPHAVAVRVHERADVQTIEDGVLVPEVVDHAYGGST